MKTFKLIVSSAFLLIATTQAQASGEGIEGRSIGGACCPFSDKTLKTDIEPLTHATQKLLQLQGTTFKWKESGREDVGVIAQDVQKAYPQLVHEEKGNLQVDYDKLVAPLIESVRELDARIKALESAKSGRTAHAANSGL